MNVYDLTLGPKNLGKGRWRFRVWAPRVEQLELVILDSESKERAASMERMDRGYFEIEVEGVSNGTRYLYRINGRDERPDPASRLQPEGVHGPSAVVALDSGWSDAQFHGTSLGDAVFYEVHVGTFTTEGTFDGAISRLDSLCDLGITVVEIMPVAQFPGRRNWGYDGVAPFAVHNVYGGPDGLRRFVAACHSRGLGVAVDVVYNHLGPEGNYLEDFGPYFTDRYRTPWGKALNFDDSWCDEVRRYFIENALMWIEDYHIDALRLDAVHAIFDQSAYTFLHELNDAVHGRAEELGRRVLVIAESDLNDPKLVRHAERGGWQLDGMWADDFHHALHAKLTGERDGYYADFGDVEHVGRALRDGYVYGNRFSPHRKRRHGAPGLDVSPKRIVVCTQNHDQIGNRMSGDRLSTLVTFEQYKLAAGIVMLSPFSPLLFMGEEYGEEAPFLYFVEHGDVDLVAAVRRGRAEEFASFGWNEEPPDPQAEDTFQRSRLNWGRAESGRGRTLRSYYRELLRLRKAHGAVRAQDRTMQDVSWDEAQSVITVRRALDQEQIFLAMTFSDEGCQVRLPGNSVRWSAVFDSSDERWGGPGVAEAYGQPDSMDTYALRGHSIAMWARDRTEQRA